ncbi:MAG: phosphoribosyltransferase [Gemmatirosa sp.]
MQRLFRDRREAGRRLAEQLVPLGSMGAPGSAAARRDVIVLALPRGGVPVASEVARALRAPLDVLVVRKLGVPGQEELAMGAIAAAGTSGVVRVLSPNVITGLRIPSDAVEHVLAHELREMERREREYRGDRPPIDVRGRVVVLVDDGLATGATMSAAIGALRELGPMRIVVAVPVGAQQTCAAMRRVADACACVVETPELDGVGRWYEDFEPTTDDEVRALLVEAEDRHGSPAD